MRRILYPAVSALVAAGYVLTLLIFYPGIMTYDAQFVYGFITDGRLGDWQSPVMTALWAAIDPVAPGSASMFLLIATTYWLGFGVVALRLASRDSWYALLPLILALSPPAFVFVGVIWRDVLFACVWLLAAGIAYAMARSRAALRLPAQALALGLCAFGVLLRPNALIAAPILAATIVWPARINLTRGAILCVPVLLGCFALTQFVYYDVLGAKHRHPEQSLMVFDLGGITHFTKQNQFPASWSAEETALLLGGCYEPTVWDIYWLREPCAFVMRKLEHEEHVFGTPVITQAWVTAILHNPLAYLRHRVAFMWNFLAGDNPAMWLVDIAQPSQPLFPDRAAFAALVWLHDALKPTPLFRVGTWLLLCLATCRLAWRRRDTPEGAFAMGVCGSAGVYVLSFLAVGVASDFRYAYWAVLGAIAGSVVALSGRPQR
jgi:hypothetical protein